MTESQLSLLIKRYLSGEATEEEKAQVAHWYESFDVTAIGFEDENTKKINESTARSLKAIKEKIEQQQVKSIQKIRPLKPEQKTIHWWKAVAAAAILILLSGTAYFLLNNKQFNKEQTSIAVQPVKKDFEPGGNKAILTLGNGQQIILDSMNKGLLSMQGNTKVIKLNNGQLAYSRQEASTVVEGRKQLQPVQYNTITTPRGGQYEIVLPDGSKVWLNAASSIRFPTAFTRENRTVQITGEAYFEVAKNAAKPFIVKNGELKVEVLGTHFNVNAYKNEVDKRVTLLEGSVRIAQQTTDNRQLTTDNRQQTTDNRQQTTDNRQLLKPGQQAKIDKRGKIELVKDANINEAIAWKNNLFWFENEDVQEVMKQLSRWYDVDIKIQGSIPDLFTGSIPRDLTFSKVFEVLQKTGSIHYEMENKKIIVSP